MVVTLSCVTGSNCCSLQQLWNRSAAKITDNNFLLVCKHAKLHALQAIRANPKEKYDYRVLTIRRTRLL